MVGITKLCGSSATNSLDPQNYSDNRRRNSDRRRGRFLDVPNLLLRRADDVNRTAEVEIIIVSRRVDDRDNSTAGGS